MTRVTLKSIRKCVIMITVIEMKQTENFVQDSILMILLTAGAVFTSLSLSTSLLLCGMMMILITIRSLSDKPGIPLTAAQLAIAAVFALISGNPAAYLIFYICRPNRILSLALPSGFYFAAQLLTGERTVPVILFGVLLLVAAALVIYFAEGLILDYLSAKDQISKNVSVTAVNEMYEKKLNHELLIKNYLADRNARLEERESISRNIHNSVGHSITAAVMTLEAADMLFDSAPDKAREKMKAANDRIRGSLDSIRRAVRVLDTESSYVSMDDLISSITAVTDGFVMDTMIKILTDFADTSAGIAIPHEYAEFLTGAVQELLSNGVRHGGADRFIVSMNSDSGNIRLNVSDNGKSDFSPKNSRERIRSGFGLKKLVSYTERCGGSAVFDNENGFRAVITLPLHTEEEDNG